MVTKGAANEGGDIRAHRTKFRRGLENLPQGFIEGLIMVEDIIEDVVREIEFLHAVLLYRGYFSLFFLARAASSFSSKPSKALPR